MAWKLKERQRYAIIEQDTEKPRTHRGTFFIGPRHVKHHASKEFIEFTYVENPDFASEGNCRVFAQNSHIAIEVYDFYNKLFDPDYENVSVYDERFEVQYLFKEPDTWRSTDYYNPRIEVTPLEDGVDIKKTFDTDYGPETLKIIYTVRAGARLKHTIAFTNKTAQQRTFRVVMKLSGITSDKVKYGQVEKRIIEEKHIISPFMFFGENDQHQKLSEYLWSLGETDEETGEWSPTTLKDIVLDVHASGSKCDIIIGNYTLAEDESLLIDPDSDTWAVAASLDDTHEVRSGGPRDPTYPFIYMWYAYQDGGMRWVDVGIPQASSIISAIIEANVLDTSKDSPIGTLIYGQDIGNAPNFASPASARLEDRVKTSNSVAWLGADIGAGWKDSPDISSVIEEIVGRGDWVSGYSLALILWVVNAGTLFALLGWDISAEDAPRLVVTWTPPGVDPPTVTTQPVNGIGFD